jgi:hypothetical protein
MLSIRVLVFIASALTAAANPPLSPLHASLSDALSPWNVNSARLLRRLETLGVERWEDLALVERDDLYGVLAPAEADVFLAAVQGPPTEGGTHVTCLRGYAWGPLPVPRPAATVKANKAGDAALFHSSIASLTLREVDALLDDPAAFQSFARGQAVRAYKRQHPDYTPRPDLSPPPPPTTSPPPPPITSAVTAVPVAAGAAAGAAAVRATPFGAGRDDVISIAQQIITDGVAVVDGWLGEAAFTDLWTDCVAWARPEKNILTRIDPDAGAPRVRVGVGDEREAGAEGEAEEGGAAGTRSTDEEGRGGGGGAARLPLRLDRVAEVDVPVYVHSLGGLVSKLGPALAGLGYRDMGHLRIAGGALRPSLSCFDGDGNDSGDGEVGKVGKVGKVGGEGGGDRGTLHGGRRETVVGRHGRGQGDRRHRAAYRPHLDTSDDPASNVVFSAIYYLNREWAAGDGGELRVVRPSEWPMQRRLNTSTHAASATAAAAAASATAAAAAAASLLERGAVHDGADRGACEDTTHPIPPHCAQQRGRQTPTRRARHTTTTVDIAPLADRLVLFRSGDVVHQVNAVINGPRMALSMWVEKHIGQD